MILEKHGDQSVPLLIQGTIHGECLIRDPGGAGQFLVLVTDVYKHSGNVLRPEIATGFFNGALLIFLGQL